VEVREINGMGSLKHFASYSFRVDNAREDELEPDVVPRSVISLREFLSKRVTIWDQNGCTGACQSQAMVAMEEFKPRLTPAVAAEFIGMFLATFLSSACAANAADNGLAAAALGTGFAFAMITYSTAHISGGHLNPAITAAYMAVSANGFTIGEGVSYMIAQFVGAISGAFLIKSILPIEALVHPFVTLGSLSDKHGEQVATVVATAVLAHTRPLSSCSGTRSRATAARGAGAHVAWKSVSTSC
jgi:hypothetical protein